MNGRLTTRLGGGRLKIKKKVVKKKKEGDADNHQAQHINPATKDNVLVSSESSSSSSSPSTSSTKKQTVGNHKNVLTSQGTTTTVRISTTSTVSEVSGR